MPRYLSLCIRAAPAPEAGRAPQLTPARLADWCRRFTPLAAADAPDGAMLDIAGAAHLFGGETALAEDIEGRLAGWGYTARAALADTPEAAWALARYATARAAPAGAEEKILRRLFGAMPMAALRLAPETVYALSQTGLKRVDDLIMRPRAPIAARFGAQVFARLDGLMGRLKSPITPRFEAPPYLVERRFAEPLLQREAIERVIATLAADMQRLLERHGEGARRLEARLFRVDGVVRRIEIATSRPQRDPRVLARLFGERITALSAQNEDPLASDYGFDLVQLATLVAEGFETQGQTLSHWERVAPEAPGEGLRSSPLEREALHDSKTLRSVTPHPARLRSPPSPNGRGYCDSPENLADLVDRLGARLGLRRVLRFQANGTHIPEFAVTCVEAARMPTLSHWESHAQTTESVTPHPAPSAPPSPNGRGLNPARPIRLFESPEPIDALAEVPDGPPRRFRWRRVMHEIAAIEGPERISPEWWKAHAAALTRDYFRVEDTQGHRFWLYREGLYGAETARPRWFMHGLFA